MAKFVVYEKVSEAAYKNFFDKEKTSSGMQTVINLGSGLIAGFAAAIVSQPADTMLSKINKTKGLPGEGTTSRLIKIARELGHDPQTCLRHRYECKLTEIYRSPRILLRYWCPSLHGRNLNCGPVCNLW